jgi:transcriptional regulator with XRE-family HTH domain
MTPEKFGKRLFNLFVDRGWTQSELARRSGVPRESVSDYVRGHRLPDANDTKLLADAFGLTPDQLLYGDDEATP